MNDKTIISFATLTGTLTGYYLSRWNEKHRIPFMLVGGFFGTLVGEVMVRQRSQKQMKRIKSNVG